MSQVNRPSKSANEVSRGNGTGMSRRWFMATAAATGITLAAPGLINFNGSAAQAAFTPASLPGGPTDGATQFAAIPGRNINEKVLNFALTLEILEADLYRQALNLASNRPLTAALDAKPGNYVRRVDRGGLTREGADIGFLYLRDFAYVEAAHRDFLNGAIKAGGGVPVTRNPGGYKFASKPASNIASILGGILPLEETGVRAYLGALPYLEDLGLATVAGGIFSTEARHSAAVSAVLGVDSGPAKMNGDLSVTPAPPAQNTFEYYLKPTTVLQAASVFFA